MGHLLRGIYDLNGWGISGSNGWSSYGKVSYCFLEDMLKKHWCIHFAAVRVVHSKSSDKHESSLTLRVALNKSWHRLI